MGPSQRAWGSQVAHAPPRPDVDDVYGVASRVSDEEVAGGGVAHRPGKGQAPGEVVVGAEPKLDVGWWEAATEGEQLGQARLGATEVASNAGGQCVDGHGVVTVAGRDGHT